MIQNTLRHRRRLLLCTAISLGLSGTVHAQQTASVVLDPVTLRATQAGEVQGYRAEDAQTATRTDTPLRDIPQSVNVVGREELDERQVTTLTAALEAVPNIANHGTSANRSETFILRGFETRGYALDGMMLNASSDRPELMMDMAGIERVEVLKGPASVLYGMGDPGGVINMVSRRPDATPGGQVKLGYGSFGFKRVEATATGALNASGTLTGRITAAAQDEEGWVKDRPGSDRQYLGGVLEWAPSDRSRLSFALEHTATKQPFDRGLVLDPTTDDVLEPYDSWLGEDWSMVDAEKTRGLLRAEHDISENLLLRGSLGFDFGHSYDTGIDHQNVEADGTLIRRYTERTEDTATRDLRLEALWKLDSGAIHHEVLAGVQYNRSHMEFDSARAGIDPINIHDPVHVAPMPTAEPNASYDEVVRTRSVYLQDQISFSEQWKMLAGLRWDHAQTQNDDHFDQIKTEREDEALTGRLGVVWQRRNDLSLYASWAQSFRPQSGEDINGDPLDPEEGEQFEIGAKWDVTPHLSSTVSVFQITKSQVATSVDGEDYSRLTGEQRSRGFEAEIAGEVMPGWNIHAGLGYLDAEVTADNEIPEGNELAGVPHVNARLWTTYRFQQGPAQDLTIGGGLTHVGARKGDLENSFEVDGYTRLDAMARYEFESGAELSLAVNNLTDEDYVVSTASDREIVAGAPRNLRVQLGWAF
ncbi:TonB-dependent siderophore receptor [Paracoccus laeviglucosivorans]|uniref:Iron complex outermembrane recepter protein n=1 Tax=Paracoccus laeviglucosivorans TaxID=1197861 RepID=A0A521ET32_9RHOB|nr:TonB-dependent siderophore receptor [Paracoccus laeviglucosivorans]SMO87079.1 iron complex outermembrane recepter protein [Paracoccus laeviglucosivorans]